MKKVNIKTVGRLPLGLTGPLNGFILTDAQYNIFKINDVIMEVLEDDSVNVEEVQEEVPVVKKKKKEKITKVVEEVKEEEPEVVEEVQEEVPVEEILEPEEVVEEVKEEEPEVVEEVQEEVPVERPRRKRKRKTQPINEDNDEE